MENEEHSAKVITRNAPISTKVSIEICSFIRGRKLSFAVNQLNLVLKKKQAVPYKRFNRQVAHKASVKHAGRYPQNASKEFLNLLNTLKANAIYKGLNEEGLVISEAIANRGPGRFHYGRMRGIRHKSTHIELRAVEGEKKIENKKKGENMGEKKI